MPGCDPAARRPADRRSGSGGSSKPALRRAADKGDGWLPQGPPEGGMKRAIAWLHERREANGRADRPFAVGANAEILFLGEPWFEVGPQHLTGEPEPMAERLRRYRGVGVDQIQIRFRSRSAAELCDQIDRFGAEVAPLPERLTRPTLHDRRRRQRTCCWRERSPSCRASARAWGATSRWPWPARAPTSPWALAATAASSRCRARSRRSAARPSGCRPTSPTRRTASAWPAPLARSWVGSTSS